MIIKQLYTNCLSEAAYFVASGNEAVIIDPMRDVAEYLALAAEYQVQIRYIFETHFHADFISGHLDLAEKTGAPIVYGPNAKTGFSIYSAKEGELFQIGKLQLEVIHTPGHTLESTCYLLRDEEGKPYCVFTGDTLFVGDTGRPDLSSGNLGKEQLAEYLYDSLQRLKQLPDDVIVYPAHGPGSACGKHIDSKTSSTIGEQKRLNHAMKATGKADFVTAVTEGLTAPPAYFTKAAMINKEGYDALEVLIEKSNHALDVPALKAWIKKGAFILDTRDPVRFTGGFVPGSINIGLRGRFAEWAGQLLPFDTPLVLITSPGEEKETIVRLARVGFDKVRGYLKNGIDSWKEAGESLDLIVNVDAEELALDIPYDKNLLVVDVRKPSEFAGGHVEGALNINLTAINDPLELSRIEETHNLYIHCQSGYRSVIACSLIKRQGFHNLRNVTGGFEAISRESGDINIVRGAATVLKD